MDKDTKDFCVGIASDLGKNLGEFSSGGGLTSAKLGAVGAAASKKLLAEFGEVLADTRIPGTDVSPYRISFERNAIAVEVAGLKVFVRINNNGTIRIGAHDLFGDGRSQGGLTLDVMHGQWVAKNFEEPVVLVLDFFREYVLKLCAQEWEPTGARPARFNRRSPHRDPRIPVR